MIYFLFPSYIKEERGFQKRKKKNLLFADLPESPDIKGVQVTGWFYDHRYEQNIKRNIQEKEKNITKKFIDQYFQVGAAPGSRPSTKLGSASSTRSRHFNQLLLRPPPPPILPCKLSKKE